MKKALLKMHKKVVSGLLAFSMGFGFCYNAFPKTASAENSGVESGATESVDSIKYVSIGDSMTNGYCFTGYEQGDLDAGEFLANSDSIYGEGSYALLFEDWLAEEYGAVEHSKMAVSALRAEDLLYLLGGREKPTDGWFDQVNHYTGEDDDAKLIEYYTEEVSEADVITLGIGNAAFGAYLVQYITRAIGVMGGSLDEDEVVTLDDAMALVEDETTKLIINKVYAKAIE